MNDDEKIQRLRRYYDSQSDTVARRVLDSLACKKNWRSFSLVHRVAQETQLSESEVTSFFKKKLEEELDIGVWKKGTKDSKSRFEWKVDEPFEYSLVSVGLAAQGKSNTLLFSGSQPVSEDGEEDEAGTLEIAVPLPRGRSFKATFPRDLTQEEFENFVGNIRLHLSSE